jgi:hypothetical protein
MKKKNNCPVCGNEMEEDDKMYYCAVSGTNINKGPEVKPNEASDGENMNFTNVVV